MPRRHSFLLSLDWFLAPFPKGWHLLRFRSLGTLLREAASPNSASLPWKEECTPSPAWDPRQLTTDENKVQLTFGASQGRCGRGFPAPAIG